uniref:CD99 antigen-like protein 2 n=1 Tax=Equus caballus TaxID=9796 RepID=F7ABF8_HORSE
VGGGKRPAGSALELDPADTRALRPRPSRRGPAPETAVSPRPSRRSLSPAPPHLGPAGRAPPPPSRSRVASRPRRSGRGPAVAARLLLRLLPKLRSGRSRANCTPRAPSARSQPWWPGGRRSSSASLSPRPLWSREVTSPSPPSFWTPGSGDFGNDFSVEDALKETSSVKQRWDRVTTTTKRPATTKAPAKPAGADLDLADALDDRNDPNDGRRKPSAGGGGFSDKDLEDIAWGGGYKPDKGKGDDPYGSNDDPASGMSAETGTIAGVASALAMALIGAVSSYISYQQKKFCFSIQQGLNADYVKGENLEAVVCEEPQVKYSALQTQSAEPPPQPPRL